MRYTLWLLLFFISASFACEVIDDSGQRIRLSQPAQRIVSLAPDLTELLFAAGAGQKIVGVIQGSDYPAAAKKIPVVANYHTLNGEAILGLHPDLIVAWQSNATAQLQELKPFSIPVFLSRQHDIRDIPKTLQRLGCLAGTQQTANHAATVFSNQLNQLTQTVSNKKIITVFYEIWSHPLITVNKTSWINQIISLCGGKNIFAELKTVAPEVNPEAVLAANPDVILGSNSADWQKEWMQWPELTAVKQKHLFSLNPDEVERAGPRLLNGATEICQDLEQARHQIITE